MRELRKIYLVTTGHYSDYGIRAAFASRKRARKFIADAGNALEAPQVEVFTVDEPGRWVSITNLNMYRDGELYRGIQTQQVWQSELEASFVDKSSNIDGAKFSLIQARNGFTGTVQHYMTINVETDSHEHAVKVANEHRVRLIESGQWPEDTRTVESALLSDVKSLSESNRELRARAVCDAVLIEQLQSELDELRS